MSDEQRIPQLVSLALAPELIARIDQSCKLALAKQLNKNESDPGLKMLADKWKDMSNFSTREQGEKDTLKTGDMPRPTPGAVQVYQGQTAEVTGPATVYGGHVEIEKPAT